MDFNGILAFVTHLKISVDIMFCLRYTILVTFCVTMSNKKRKELRAMSTKTVLLALLHEKNGSFVSGQDIASRLGVSRNAIWKAVKSLQEQGFEVESQAGVGYRLAAERDIISKDVLADEIKYPCSIHVFDKIDSTNNYAKKIEACKTPQLIIASEQTAGRGRLGRSFYSPAEKGIYMSIAFEPDFDLDKSLFVTTLSAVAACRAIEDVAGLRPKIKWVNDIYLDGRKLAGILTEAESNFESGRIQKIIVGIGITCFSCDLPEQIRDIAACLEQDTSSFTRNKLIASFCNRFFEMIANFDQSKILREYKNRSFILGEQILIYNPAIARQIGRPGERLHDGIRARAIDIDENGGLVVEYLEGRMSHQMQTLTSGEISIRKV